jgi:hypothetical protein
MEAVPQATTAASPGAIQRRSLVEPGPLYVALCHGYWLEAVQVALLLANNQYTRVFMEPRGEISRTVSLPALPLETKNFDDSAHGQPFLGHLCLLRISEAKSATTVSG